MKWLPILLIPIVILKPFHYLYFPFAIFPFLVGVLAIYLGQKAIKYKTLALVGIFSIFFFFLFSQPLILQKQGFGYNDEGALINAITIWNFNSNQAVSLPNDVLIDADGMETHIQEVDNIAFITFWATWCAPCMEERPAIKALKARYAQDKNIQFIDISFDQSASIWHKYLAQDQPSGLQLLSKNHRRTSRKFDFAGLPMHLIVDKNGYYKKYRSLDIAIQNIPKSL